MSVPVFITCRDRVQCLRLLVDRLEALDGLGPIFLIDNDSEWPPMLDYLRTTPHEVVRVGLNAGHRALWTLDIHPQLRESGPFVVTDPDVIPDSDCPPDAITYLVSLLDHYPHVIKAGLGLRIDDLPEGSDLTQDVKDWESQFWDVQLEPGVFDADVDTTFAVYRPGAGPDHGPALRTGAPYLARHIPWYFDPNQPDAEEFFYRARSRPDSTNWHSRTLQPPLAAALARRRRQLQGLSDHPLLDAWAAEPDLCDESEFTPWADRGWLSWNSMAAEQDFCEFVGLVVRLLQPPVVVESGIGQGFTTRRINQAQRSGEHLCFESDPELRNALASLPFFLDPEHHLSSNLTASEEEFGRADLTVLDSDPPYRHEELALWRESARAGSSIVIHDCGHEDQPDVVHGQLRKLILELDVPGVFLRNPRGGFLGVHPGPAGPHQLQAELAGHTEALLRLRQELLLARDELDRTRMTMSWRLTRPLRAMQAGRLRRAQHQPGPKRDPMQ